MTRIITNHDLEILKALYRRTIILDEGRVTADGPTEDILSDIPLLQVHGLIPPRQA